MGVGVGGVGVTNAEYNIEATIQTAVRWWELSSAESMESSVE